MATSKFFTFLNDVFDCLNSKNLFDRNPLKRGLRHDTDKVQNFLKNAIETMQKIVDNNCSTKVYCFEGLIQTFNGVL